jgi:hypothetical protein
MSRGRLLENLFETNFKPVWTTRARRNVRVAPTIAVRYIELEWSVHDSPVELHAHNPAHRASRRIDIQPYGNPGRTAH